MDSGTMLAMWGGLLGLGLLIAACAGLATSKKPGPISEADVEAAHLLANSGVTDADWDTFPGAAGYCGC